MVRVGSSVEWLKDIDQQDAYAVGSIIAAYGEYFSQGIPFAPGFVIPNSVYISFFAYNNLELKIKHLLSTLHYDDERSVSQVSYHIQRVIQQSHLAPEVLQEIQSFYKMMSGTLTHTAVLIQPSVVSNASRSLSMTMRIVQGEAAVVESIKEVYAQMFTPAALLQAHQFRRSPFSDSLALLITRVLSPEISGVLFTHDPVSKSKDILVIEAVYGLKEIFLDEMLTPDHYEVNRSTGEILQKQIATQEMALFRSGSASKKEKLSQNQSKKQKLDEGDIRQLVELGNRVQQLMYFPQDIEWCFENNVLYVTGCTPIPIEQEQVPEHKIVSARLKARPLIRGIAHGKGIHSGMVKIVKYTKDTEKVYTGDVLVTSKITYDLIPAIKRAGAVITEFGGLSSSPLGLHSFGKPMVSGVAGVTDLLKQGGVVTVDGMTGEIFRGSVLSLEKDIQDFEIEEYSKTKTNVIVQLDSRAEKDTQTTSDGVVVLAGSIIKEFGIHPRKLLREGDADVLTNKIDIQLSHAYDSMYKYQVFYQLSDLTPAEYKKLHGSNEYESMENDSILGYRGTYRLLHEPDILQIELKALEQFYFRHKPAVVNLVFPTVRNKGEVQALEKHLRTISHHKTQQHIWLTVDTPLVALSLDSFMHTGIAGVVLDIALLATLLTGIDESALGLSHTQLVENPVLEAFVQKIIQITHKLHKKIFVKGVNDFESELFEKVIHQKVDGVIVAYSQVGKARKKILSLEERETK